MRHVVRRVTTADRRETVGYGVFMGWNVTNISEQGSVCIDRCTDPDDDRPLRKQPGKAYKMKELYSTLETATSKALQLSAQKVQPR